jgi:pimeloyl-ACP methyl ester carboxylesterase
MVATATPKFDRTIGLRDGRQLAYCEWGALDGNPVVLLHGSPGSRLFCPDEDATKAAGVRLLTIDRPGYGRSDPRPSSALLDWPDDYIELADQLHLPPCPVIGWSAGGRYALALRYRAPDLVTTIGVAGSPGPIDHVPGALDELSLEDRDILALLAHDRGAGLAAIEKNFAWFAGNGWETIFAESWGAADDSVLGRPQVLAALKAAVQEGGRRGPAGFAADEVAWIMPWGFSVAEIRRRVHVWRGDSDGQVGRAHADYLARSILQSNLVTFENAGHLFPIIHWGEMLDSLLH